MNLAIRFLPEAKAEFDAATDWYEQQRAGLGTDFVARVRAVLSRIAADPQAHAAVYGDVRKVVVRQFPYSAGSSRIAPHRRGSERTEELNLTGPH